MSAGALERLSIEVTNQCGKACWFCYAGSTPEGATRWTADELVALVEDCARHGVRAVSFGGGEPLEYPALFEVLRRLRGAVFRSVTSNGLLLEGARFEELVAAAPDKVHVSVHFPADADRAIALVARLSAAGIHAGVNLLVPRSQLEATAAVAGKLRAAGIGNDRIVYLPMRHQDTPSPRDVAKVAGGDRFQSMSCLARCAASPRFCSVAWDRTVAWCSYTKARRPLPEPSFRGLARALDGLGLDFCGGTA